MHKGLELRRRGEGRKAWFFAYAKNAPGGYGGYNPETIKSLDTLIEEYGDISRMGGDGGNALGFGRNPDGTLPTASQRSLLKTEEQAVVTTGTMDLKKYKEIVDIVADDKISSKAK